MKTFFYAMSSEELKEYELDLKMNLEITEMYQMDEDDVFEKYGVENHHEAENFIIEYYREIA